MPARKPRNPAIRSHFQLIASPRQALQAAAAYARQAGIATLLLGELDGEARELARRHAELVRQIRREGRPLAAPCLILSGGETTVAVRGAGRGGRNSEYLLALADSLRSEEGIYALAADTDGIDGSEDNAGAWLTPDSAASAAALGLDAGQYLADNDAYGYFAALGQLLITGPTRTNVNDLRAILLLK